MGKVERRKFIRKAIRMSCVVQFSSGITFYGNTRDISLDGVVVESTSMSGDSKNEPTLGESGLLTLKFKKRAIADSIQVQCRVIHLVANGLGLSASFLELNKRELDILGEMIAAGKAEVD